MSIIYIQVPCFPASPHSFLATIVRAEQQYAAVVDVCVAAAPAGGGSGLVIMVAVDLLFSRREEAIRPQRGIEGSLIPLLFYIPPLLAPSSFHLSQYFPSLPLSTVPPAQPPTPSAAEVSSGEVGDGPQLRRNVSRSQIGCC